MKIVRTLSLLLREIRNAIRSHALRRVTRDGLLQLGTGVSVHRDSRIYAQTIIGDHTRINGKLTVKGGVPVRIGKYCALGADVKIITTSHVTGRAANQMEVYKTYFGETDNDLILDKGPVVIENDVWIGDSAIILPGVRVGDGAVIAAGAVVTKEVFPYTIVAGVPAVKIRDRFPEEIKEQLRNVRWWDWSEDKIRASRQFFSLDLNRASASDVRRILGPGNP